MIQLISPSTETQPMQMIPNSDASKTNAIDMISLPISIIIIIVAVSASLRVLAIHSNSTN